MNDYQEYRSYGSYLSRVFAIIIAFALLVLAIWFVVRLATDNKDSGTLGDTTTSTIDRDISINPTTPDTESQNGQVAGSSTTSDVPAADGEENGQTLSTSTDTDPNYNSSGNVAGTTTEVLPDTGANPAILLIAPLAVFMVSKAVLVRQEA
jgi:hypothetical protein